MLAVWHISIVCHTRCAFSNCCRATVLSRNVSGASPQSMILAQFANVFSPTSISISFNVTTLPFDNHLCRHSSQIAQTCVENPVGYLSDRIGHQALRSRPAGMLSSSSIRKWHDYCEWSRLFANHTSQGSALPLIHTTRNRAMKHYVHLLVVKQATRSKIAPEEEMNRRLLYQMEEPFLQRQCNG